MKEINKDPVIENAGLIIKRHKQIIKNGYQIEVDCMHIECNKCILFQVATQSINNRLSCANFLRKNNITTHQGIIDEIKRLVELKKKGAK